MKKQVHGFDLVEVSGVAIVIVLGIAGLIKVPELIAGNSTGWLPVVMLSLYIAIALPKGLNYSLLAECLFGCIYGLFLGYIFSIFMPGLLIGIWLLLTCRLAGYFPKVMNDYGLTLATVYTIPGVGGVNHILMAIPTFIVGVIIVILLTAVVVHLSRQKQAATRSSDQVKVR